MERRPYLAQRDRYVELRRSGLDTWAARDELTVSEGTRVKLERFFRALERGETPLQKRPGPGMSPLAVVVTVLVSLAVSIAGTDAAILIHRHGLARPAAVRPVPAPNPSPVLDTSRGDHPCATR